LHTWPVGEDEAELDTHGAAGVARCHSQGLAVQAAALPRCEGQVRAVAAGAVFDLDQKNELITAEGKVGLGMVLRYGKWPEAAWGIEKEGQKLGRTAPRGRCETLGKAGEQR